MNLFGAHIVPHLSPSGEALTLAQRKGEGVRQVTGRHRLARGERRMRYHHLGIPTEMSHADEQYVEHLKFHCTDHESNPFGIQWMRFDPDCPLPDLVKGVAHVAFEVEDLEAAIAGHELLIAPNSPSAGVLVAFIVIDGAPVELLQFTGGRHSTQ
jgi:hypothetical protein